MIPLSRQTLTSATTRWALYLTDFGNSAYAALAFLAAYATCFQRVKV